MNFVSAINYQVKEVKKTVGFLCQHFGFVTEQQNDYATTVNNGAITIRLIKSSLDRPIKLCLDYQTDDLDLSYQKFLKTGFSSKGEIVMLSQFRHQILMTGDAGFDILLYRLFNEDDLGINLDLPTTLEWQSQAVDLAQTLLKEVPIEFREQARKKVTAQAESNAVIEGKTKVALGFVVKAMVTTTPPFKLEELYTKLASLGIDAKLSPPQG